ncbi:LAG1 longevity assurance homolog 2-like [Juglans regia]|uniref:LAG1 longevity assurance homolog 2-like n=1 Tax=Juglans regia TaxID=51240 RepID=A0A6P9EEQ2_JUGRE|nr:LAG1 longevity assurance homolog 2-like [Juglans regia]
MDSIWSHNGAPHPCHFVVAVFFALGFVVARFSLDKLIFRRLAIRLLSNGTVPLKTDEATRVKFVKCSESMWKLTYYAAVEACILKITYNEPWLMDRKGYFRGWPNQELLLPLKLFYMCQCGFYVYSIAALLTWETRRKDFSVMMSHHVITIALIGYSYITSFFRIGSVILALHDASDIFMEAAEVFKYSEKELAASVFFGFFAVSWLILRLVFFPLWVIKASRFALRVIDFNSPDVALAYPTLLYYVFNTMLLMLLVFHIYWWVLICSMIQRQLKNRGKVGEDIRSDSEDDE